MSTTVVVAAAGAAWESALLSTADSQASGIVVVRRCMDVVELVSVALTGQASVAVVSARLRGLDADIVDQLVVAGVTPVAVTPRDADGLDGLLDGLRTKGIRHVVSDDAGPSVIASVVHQAAADTDPLPSSRSFALPGSRSHGVAGELDVAAADPVAARNGSVVAVWGPAGSPGRTTVAVTLADEIARLRADVMLVDADVYGGTVAARLGILDESPGLAAACRAVATKHSDPAAAIAALAWQLGPRLRVVTGLPLPQRWPEIRPAGLSNFLGICRTWADWTVVDLGFSIEADEELSFDSIAPRRNGATLTVLDEADTVLVVGEGDPVGMQRLASALLELGDAGLAANTSVVLNKVRPGFGAGDAAGRAADALHRFTGRSPVACLPYDRDSLDAALAAGRSLAEVRPRSRVRQGVAQLARDVTGLAGARAGRRHARR